MRANWFIAIPIDTRDWHARLPPPPSGTRLFAPEDVHLTIAFLGTVSDAGAEAAWRALEWTLPTLEVTLDRVVPMGSPARFTALSALLGEGRAEVEHAMTLARDAPCDAAGARREQRPAKAHVTLARPSRHASGHERRAALAWAEALELGAPRIRLSRIALYTWSDQRPARLFRVVSERALETA